MSCKRQIHFDHGVKVNKNRYDAINNRFHFHPIMCLQFLYRGKKGRGKIKAYVEELKCLKRVIKISLWEKKVLWHFIGAEIKISHRNGKPEDCEIFLWKICLFWFWGKISSKLLEIVISTTLWMKHSIERVIVSCPKSMLEIKIQTLISLFATQYLKHEYQLQQPLTFLKFSKYCRMSSFPNLMKKSLYPIFLFHSLIVSNYVDKRFWRSLK